MNWHLFAYGLIGGIAGGWTWLFSPWERKRRKRRLLAYRHALAASSAITHGDRLAALTHTLATITYMENKDPLTIEQWVLSEVNDQLGSKVRDPEMP